MKAKMTIVSSRVSNIKPFGGASQGRAGHSFALLARLKVSPRTLGSLSGEGIDCPHLEWKEVIEWFEFDEKGSAWTLRGTDAYDMYRKNPNSNTFRSWNEMRYALATYESSAPSDLRKVKGDEKGAKHWIARNGFEWEVPIVDVPAMGLSGGSRGGGGESRVVGPSRRRVIHFDLGFSGGGPRAQASQILETLNGDLTIHKFIDRELSRAQASDPANLARWRAKLRSPQNWRI
jgi:hypothetical protein